MTISAANLIWIDLEMTGLNPRYDRIIEIATIVTDTNLNILAEGPSLAINQSQELITGMDEWNTEHHTKSGLVDRVLNTKVTDSSAEKQTIEFLQQWVPAGKSPMCGNTICQDRRFLANYMPDLEAYFHYRNLDVTSVKILADRWAPEVTASHTKVSQHIALQDIRDSITELKHYQQHFLKISNPS